MKPPATSCRPTRNAALRKATAHLRAARRYALLGPLVLMAACASAQQRTAHRLDQRLQTALAPDIAAGDVAVQRLPTGARVTLVRPAGYPARYPDNVDAPDVRQHDIRAGMIEGLLDPSLMQIQVDDTSTLPDDLRADRVREVTQYIVDNGLGQTLQPAALSQSGTQSGTQPGTQPVPQAMHQPPARGPAGSVPAGLIITISVHCPHYHDWAGYGSGQAKPACD